MVQERLTILAGDIKDTYEALEEKGATIPTDKNTSNLKETVESIELEGDVAPVGMMSPFCGTKAPTGYLFCVGTAVSRETYKELFAVIGTKFGAGDGSTTFNLPDMRSRFAEGASTTTGHTLGSKVNAGLPDHSHTFIGTTDQKTSSNGGHYHQSGVKRIWDSLDSPWGVAQEKKSGGQNCLRRYDNGSTYYDIDYTSSSGSHSHKITAAGTIDNASKHNALYGKSSTVQPAAICVQWIIKY